MASIEKRGGSYKVIASCGYSTDGRKVRKSMTWTPDPGMTAKQIEKELHRQAVLFDERVRSGQFLDGNIKFAEFAEKWMREYSERQHKDKTIAANKEALTRINAAIGHIKLCKLQPHHIMEYLHQLEEPGQNKKTGGPLSTKTISNHLRIISSILSVAVEWQVIPSNPALRVKGPKIERKEAKSFDDLQAARVLDAIKDEPAKYALAVELLMLSGARRGEVLALCWGDVNFDSCTVKIDKAQLYLPDKGIYTTTPKNESSNRVIKLPRSVITSMKRYRTIQKEERLKCGDQWQGDDHIFTQWNGLPMHPDTISRWFKKFVRRQNQAILTDGTTTPEQKAELLFPELSIHGLRHTNASLLIANGANIRTVASRLGHAQVSTTTNIYSHAIKTADAMASDALEAVLLKKYG